MAGLSPTLGAFMAGMLLGETLFRHQIEADIRPFRDLMGLFFATIGMQLDPKTIIPLLAEWKALHQTQQAQAMPPPKSSWKRSYARSGAPPGKRHKPSSKNAGTSRCWQLQPIA